jgi:hypothetical protein
VYATIAHVLSLLTLHIKKNLETKQDSYVLLTESASLPASASTSLPLPPNNINLNP